METTTTKSGFSVIQIVEIPGTFLRKNVLKALSGREILIDKDFAEAIFSGDVFNSIAEEYENRDFLLRMSDEDLEQVNDLAKELGDFELIRINKKERNIDKMKRLFFESKENKSGDIKLDNLDEARLVRISDEHIEVENEHGTRFPIEDLSKEEIKFFIYLLEY